MNPDGGPAVAEARERPARARGERGSVVGLCLCGGASRRMGEDKALAALGARLLIEYPLAALESVASRTLLACGPTPRYAELGYELVLDSGPGEGPLRGLLAGLEAARAEGAEWLAVAACDMPRLSGGALGELLAHARREELDVCLAEVERGIQPLLGVYRTLCAGPVRAALERGERRLVAFHGERVDGRPLRVGALRRARFDEEARNLNTLEELAAERALEREGSGP
jgi:molybdopterin-guanine dinucleotide biosynthesis protein A